MGKARIKISWELLQQSLQMPTEWTLVTAYVQTIPSYGNQSHQTLHLIVEGENIEDKDAPVDFIAKFKSKTIDKQDGRWIQGHWEIFR